MHDTEFVDWLRSCKFNLVTTSIDNKYFVFKPVYQFNDWKLIFNKFVKIQDEDKEIQPIGWIVEYKLNTLSFEPWETTKKLYETKEVAMHAIIQMQRCYANYEWRVKPVYIFDKQTWRNYAIYEILRDI